MSTTGLRLTFEAFARQALDASTTPRAAAQLTQSFMAVARGHDPSAELWLSIAVPAPARRLRLLACGETFTYPVES